MLKKGTQASIKKALQPYLNDEGYYQFILQKDLDEIMKMIMTEFSGVYCGAYQIEAGLLVFSVDSNSRRRIKYFGAIIK